MPVEHANVSASNIHECKAANTAAINTVRISNGAGSGSWAKVGPTSLTGVNNVNQISLNVGLPDVSAPASHWVIAPFAGVITKLYTVLEGPITLVNAGITLKIAGVTVTNSALTITAVGSAAGDVDSSTPSALRTVTAGQAIEIVLDGASSTSAKANAVIVIDIA